MHVESYVCKLVVGTLQFSYLQFIDKLINYYFKKYARITVSFIFRYDVTRDYLSSLKNLNNAMYYVYSVLTSFEDVFDTFLFYLQEIYGATIPITASLSCLRSQT